MSKLPKLNALNTCGFLYVNYTYTKLLHMCVCAHTHNVRGYVKNKARKRRKDMLGAGGAVLDGWSEKGSVIR